MALLFSVTACGEEQTTQSEAPVSEAPAPELAAAPAGEKADTKANVEPQQNTTATSEKAQDSRWQERTLGNPNAPVKIIEYASMTCVHCATFNKDVKPAIKKYIDDGKVYFIYRDFPSDFLALEAAQLARCMPENRYFPFVDVIFNRRDYWIDQEKGSARLKQLAGLAGLDENAVQECLDDKQLETAILNKRTEALTKFNITATPTVVVNGKNKGSLTKPARMIELIEDAL